MTDFDEQLRLQHLGELNLQLIQTNEALIAAEVECQDLRLRFIGALCTCGHVFSNHRKLSGGDEPWIAWRCDESDGCMDFVLDLTTKLAAAEARAELAERRNMLNPQATEYVKELEVELDRYREALERIAQYDPRWTGQHVNDAPARAKLIAIAFDALIARQAIQEQSK